MKATRLFLQIGLLAFIFVLSIAPAALAQSTPVLTTTVRPATATDQAAFTTARPATTTVQAAFTAVHAALFVAGLVIGLLFFGLMRNADASRMRGHQVALGMSREAAEERQHKTHKHVIHV